MRNILLLLAMVVLTQSFKPNVEPSDREKHKLRGPVSSYTLKQHDAVKQNEGWVKGRASTFYTTTYFDENGDYQGVKEHEGDSLIFRTEVRGVGAMREEIRYTGSNEPVGKVVSTYASGFDYATEAYDPKGNDLSYGSTTAETSVNVTQTRTIIYYINGEKDDRQTYDRHDDDGNLVLRRVTNNDDATYCLRYQYTRFDRYRNWTERLVYFHWTNGEDLKTPVFVETRTIEYYTNVANG